MSNPALNTGTITVNNIIVNDITSYSQSYFSLTEGKLVVFIDSLRPGETFTFNYTIKAKRQSLVTLNPASITFYYLQKTEEQSNTLNIKIITPQLTQFTYIFLPIFTVSIILTAYFWQNNKYKRRKMQLKRAEMHIFDLNSRDSVLKFESTLRDRFNILSKESKKDERE